MVRPMIVMTPIGISCPKTKGVSIISLKLNELKKKLWSNPIIRLFLKADFWIATSHFNPGKKFNPNPIDHSIQLQV